MADVHLIVDGAVLAEELRGPGGMVARFMMERATAVQGRSREILGPHNKTGCLSSCIVKRPESIDGEFGVRLVADTTPCSPTRTSYALFVHEGTSPHEITPSTRQALAFDWHGSRAVFARVHHPGTSAIPFLRDALPAAFT